jgi:putative SOS response-associated peptidase YedK
MPVILSVTDFAVWLDPENNDIAGLSDLLRPAPPHDWTLIPVSKQVNNARNEGPELIQPVTPVAGSAIPEEINE